MRKPRHERLAEAANGLLLPAVVTSISPLQVLIHGSETSINSTIGVPSLPIAVNSLVWVTRAGSKTIIMGLRENTAFGSMPTVYNVGASGNPAFQNGWVNYGGYQVARYWKNSNNEVTVEGLVKSGTISTTSTGEIFTLPSGFRPSATLIFTTNVDNNVVGRTQANADGSIQALSTASGGSNGYWSLAGVHFLADGS